jgi:hypothetical protein
VPQIYSWEEFEKLKDPMQKVSILFASFQSMGEGFTTLPSGEIIGGYKHGYVHV